MPAQRNLDAAIDEAAAEQAQPAEPPEPGRELDVAKPRTVSGSLADTRMRAQLRNALPQTFPGGVERFARIVQTAVRMNDQLAACTPESVIGGAFQAAQLGLTPNVLGECWLIPYRNRDTGHQEAQFQIGWKGYVALAYRSGILLSGEVVYEADYFRWRKGLEPMLTHEPADGDRGKSVYWYAVARRESDGRVLDFAVLDRTAVEKRRAASKSKDSPAWRIWYDEMALGKAARAVCRFLPLSVEAATALASDETVRTTVSGQADEFTVDNAIELEP